MLRKKIIVGSILVLTLATGVISYASYPQKENLPEGVTFQPRISLDCFDEISLEGADVISFDNMDPENLPEGVTFQEVISLQ